MPSPVSNKNPPRFETNIFQALAQSVVNTPVTAESLGIGATATYGSSEIDFGAYPGSTMCSLEVFAPDITSSMRVIPTVAARATADHSIDEHLIEGIDVKAGNIVNGISFTLYATSRTRRLTGLWAIDWSYA